ncbi:TPA: S41 family peptidase [Candidatus Uhrbacteria bacterium]|nr:MAG: Carboxyl-terminal protease [Parcubacteria group bacterium GW2011_GWA2_53_21]HBL39892.1 S41 family peptidase [Candidatus Uhrbacteria bacterium]
MDEILVEKPILSQAKVSKPVIGLFVIVVVLTTFVIGFYLGRQAAARESVPEGEGAVMGVGETPAYLSRDVDFKLFWDTWNHIKDSYYRQPVSDVELFYGALQGLVSGLDDPYSVFFDPEETEIFNEELEGSFEGVGMEIGIRNDQLQVIAPLPGTPAEKAGLRSGDKIFAIDGEDTLEMSVEDAVLRIRGERGTTVTLTISSDGLSDLRDVDVVRDTIRVDSVTWEIKDGIARVRISFFNGDTGARWREAIQEMLTSGAKGLVVDLRNNPGGLLDSAIEVAGEWVDGRPVVIERIQGVDQPMSGSGRARLADLPTVVLVNGGSASASEIVAGALKDYDLATIVGETTFGKGSVQDYQELSDGSSVKLTIAEWLTPNGNSIHETGIEPDVAVEFSLEDLENGLDPQMDAALQIINGTYDFSPETQNDPASS